MPCQMETAGYCDHLMKGVVLLCLEENLSFFQIQERK